MKFETEKELLQRVIQKFDDARDLLMEKGMVSLACQVENFKCEFFQDSNFVELEEGTYKFRKR